MSAIVKDRLADEFESFESQKQEYGVKSKQVTYNPAIIEGPRIMREKMKEWLP